MQQGWEGLQAALGPFGLCQPGLGHRPPVPGPLGLYHESRLGADPAAPRRGWGGEEGARAGSCAGAQVGGGAGTAKRALVWAAGHGKKGAEGGTR